MVVLDAAFLTLVVTVTLPVVAFLFRKRILTALGRVFVLHAAQWAKTQLFVEVEEEDGEGGRKRVLRPSPASLAILQAYVPSLVQVAVKSIKLKTGGMLPINPATGQLDFMAPVLAKLASGKKVAMEDFLPLIMDKAMPFVEGLLGGLGKKGGEKPGSKTTDAELGRVV